MSVLYGIAHPCQNTRVNRGVTIRSTENLYFEAQVIKIVPEAWLHISIVFRGFITHHLCVTYQALGACLQVLCLHGL